MNAVAMTATPSVRRGKYKTYPSSKASDVVWLKDIPAHWPIIRLKYAAPIATTKFTNKPSDLPYIGLENIESGTGQLLLSTPVEEVDGTVGVFSRGDILFGKLRPYLAKVVYATFDGACSTEVLVFRPGKDVDGRYLFYRLLSDDFINLVNSLTYGAKMPRANPEQIGTISLALPPKIEQHAIVAFLDRETVKIDALIARKERLIEVLAEKRVALISQAVTRGLDPVAPLKDSGVEWLGDIPAHWHVRRVKHVVAAPLKYGANEPAELKDPDLPRYIRITDIDDDGFLRNDTFRSLPQVIAQPYMLKVEDLLLARSGATVGKSFIYQEAWGPACYAGYLIRLRLNLRVMIPQFVYYFTASTSYWGWLASVTIQATIQNVSAEKYANLTLGVPPTHEQHEIIAFLDRETAKIDALVAKVRDHIDKLREHRTALISAAVTGKIDVREDAS